MTDESRFLLHHMDWQVCVRHLAGEHIAPGYAMGRMEARGGSVMLWVIFCWHPAIYVDATLTCTTCLIIVANHVYPFMEMVYINGSGLFQQDVV